MNIRVTRRVAAGQIGLGDMIYDRTLNLGIGDPPLMFLDPDGTSLEFSLAPPALNQESAESVQRQMERDALRDQEAEMRRQQSAWSDDVIARVTSAIIERLSTRDLPLGGWRLSLEKEGEDSNAYTVISGEQTVTDYTLAQIISPMRLELQVAITCKVHP